MGDQPSYSRDPGESFTVRRRRERGMNARDRFTLISPTPPCAVMTMELFRWSGRRRNVEPRCDVAAWVTELYIVAACVSRIRPGYVVNVHLQRK